MISSSTTYELWQATPHFADLRVSRQVRSLSVFSRYGMELGGISGLGQGLGHTDPLAEDPYPQLIIVSAWLCAPTPHQKLSKPPTSAHILRMRTGTYNAPAGKVKEYVAVESLAQPIPDDRLAAALFHEGLTDATVDTQVTFDPRMKQTDRLAHFIRECLLLDLTFSPENEVTITPTTKEHIQPMLDNLLKLE